MSAPHLPKFQFVAANYNNTRYTRGNDSSRMIAIKDEIIETLQQSWKVKDAGR